MGSPSGMLDHHHRDDITSRYTLNPNPHPGHQFVKISGSWAIQLFWWPILKTAKFLPAAMLQKKLKHHIYSTNSSPLKKMMRKPIFLFNGRFPRWHSFIFWGGKFVVPHQKIRGTCDFTSAYSPPRKQAGPLITQGNPKLTPFEKIRPANRILTIILHQPSHVRGKLDTQLAGLRAMSPFKAPTTRQKDAKKKETAYEPLKD